MAELKEKLFSDFPQVTPEAWKEKIVADLKGADFEKKLVWRTNEGFNVNPFYTAEDIEGMKATESLPGEFPYVRGTKKDNDWKVRQNVEVNCIEAANKEALDCLSRGADSLGFQIKADDVTADNIAKLLTGINPEVVELNFKTCNRKSVELITILVNYIKASGYDVLKCFGSVDYDPFKKMLVKGKENAEWVAESKVVVEAAQALPRFRVLSVNAVNFNNAGSYITQELGYALAWGNEMIAKLNEAGCPVDTVAKKIKFNFGIGANYFMEIAKFRAARWLWAEIVAAYAPKCQHDCPNNQPDGLCRCAAKMYMHATTSEWNMTIYDAHVNLLRSQTETMSAAIAGVNSITVTPFDKAYKKADEFSKRIARNQQLLLKEESHFNKVVDASAGSYYIENLTSSIADQAWKLFNEVEDMGGFYQAVKEGVIQGAVNAASAARKAAIATRREILLGTNQYPNFTEVAAAKIEKSECCGCGCSQEKTIATLCFDRGASEFEELRLATEKSGKTPKVFMLTTGNLAMRLARAQFACNFFACAGYKVVDNLGFETVESGVQAAKAAGADVIVLCSSDDEYAEFAPQAKAAIGNDAELVIAGAPACMDELKAQGIDQFINVRSNVLETLKAFNAKLGIA